MTDVFSKSKRSAVMSRISARGNEATELAFLRLLREHRITGWRRHVALTLPKPRGASHNSKSPRVRPDFVFPKSKVAIFVDGCFWHGCPIHGTSPSSNSEFWSKKLAANLKRDRQVNKQLRRKHWAVIRFWEHQMSDGTRVITKLRAKLKLWDGRTMSWSGYFSTP